MSFWPTVFTMSPMRRWREVHTDWSYRHPGGIQQHCLLKWATQSTQNPFFLPLAVEKIAQKSNRTKYRSDLGNGGRNPIEFEIANHHPRVGGGPYDQTPQKSDEQKCLLTPDSVLPMPPTQDGIFKQTSAYSPPCPMCTKLSVPHGNNDMSVKWLGALFIQN